MEAVLIAFFGAVTAWCSWRASATAKRIDEKTATNHGMEPWEYLEMILDVKENQLDLKEALLEHTVQDDKNFTELAKLIRESK